MAISLEGRIVKPRFINITEWLESQELESRRERSRKQAADSEKDTSNMATVTRLRVLADKDHRNTTTGPTEIDGQLSPGQVELHRNTACPRYDACLNKAQDMKGFSCAPCRSFLLRPPANILSARGTQMLNFN